MTADLTNPIFQDETKAREWLESKRWPLGPFCPHCGAVENLHRLEGQKHRPGLWQCNECHSQFSVTVGTVYERSHIPLHKWLLATHLMTSSKKGISAHQLHRMLGITYKSAWFMAHRIREAMMPDETPRMGGGGRTVEMDETYIGREKGKKPDMSKPKRRRGRGPADKRKVVSLVERGGKVRSFHVKDLKGPTVLKLLLDNVTSDAALMTDEASIYHSAGQHVATHDTVNHSAEEYVRGNAHTNTIEGFFSIFKRGMIGVYQHCGEQHLKRYLTEFDFRYSHRAALGINDAERAIRAIKGIEGRRLTYRRTAGRGASA